MLHGPFRRVSAVRFMLRIGHGASRPCRSAFQGAFDGLSVSLLAEHSVSSEIAAGVGFGGVLRRRTVFHRPRVPFQMHALSSTHSRNGIRARIVARSAGGSTGKKLALIRGNLGCPSSPFTVASSSVTAFTSSVQYPPFRLVGFPSASVDAAMFLTAQVMIQIIARMYCRCKLLSEPLTALIFVMGCDGGCRRLVESAYANKRLHDQ